MADAAASTLQMRRSRRENAWLFRAFFASLATHLLIFGGYKAAQHYDWKSDALLPRWLKFSRKVEEAIAAKKEALSHEQEPPLVFVNVSPAQAATEAPPDAKYYSDRSARAANPQADQITGIPKISGTQEQMPKTEDAPRNPFDRLMPDPPSVRPLPQEEARAKPAQPEGDLARVRPDLTLRPDSGTAEQSRPRTLAEARRRLELANTVPGRKMRQEGGVPNIGQEGLDVRGTLTGEYDRVFIDAVRERWYSLLEAKRYDGYQRGRVVLQFALNYDGRITDLKVLEKTVGEDLSLVCEMAVLDPAPYPPWPSDMRRAISGNQRKVQFTFFYN